MTPIKDAIQLFKEKFLIICLVVILFIVPIQIIYTLAVNYTTLPFQVLQIPLWSSIIQAFFMFVCLFIVQLPFISMAYQHVQNEEVKLGRTFLYTFKNMFPIYIVSLVMSLLIVMGSFLFFIPGFILLILCIGISYAAIMDDQTWLKGLQLSFAFGRSHFFKLSGLLLVFGVIDFALSAFAFFIVYLFTGLYILLNLTLIIVNSMVFSVFFFIVSFYYFDWSDGDFKSGATI